MEKCPNRRSARRRVTLQIIVDIVLWLAVGLPVLYLFLRGIPVERGFFCDDPTLSYPYRQDTISTALLIILGFSTSILVIVLVEALNCISSRCLRNCQSSEDLSYCVKGYAVFLLGFVVQELVVETVKNQIGFLRPNFFDVCQPQYNTTLCPGFITEYICTGSDHDDSEMRDIRQSFPSGHSAFSMYIAVYFCLYIQHRLNIGFSRFLKFLLQAGLVFMALLCGLSRIHDNKHHPGDVTAGFLVGTIVANAVYASVGRHLLSDDREKEVADDKLSDDSTDGSHTFCCARASSTSSSEPQTPAPLLANEYGFPNGSYRAPDSRTKLTDIPFKVRRHMSTPITPANKYEEV